MARLLPPRLGKMLHSCAADVRRYRTHYSGLIDRGPKRCRGKPRDIRCRCHSGYWQHANCRMNKCRVLAQAPQWASAPYLAPTLRERRSPGQAHWARLYPPSKSRSNEDWPNSVVAGPFCFWQLSPSLPSRSMAVDQRLLEAFQQTFNTAPLRLAITARRASALGIKTRGPVTLHLDEGPELAKSFLLPRAASVTRRPDASPARPRYSQAST